MIKRTIKIISLIFLILFSLVSVGCEEYFTNITMKPETGKLKRLIDVSSKDPKNQEVLKFYDIHEGSSLDEIEIEVSRDFKNHMNGVGSFNSIQTSIGSANFYSENFFGTRDFVQGMENLDKKIDTGFYLLNGWLQKNLGTTPQYVQLNKFLNSEFKKDVKNFILMIHVNFFSDDRLRRLKKNKKIEIGDDVRDELSNEFTLRSIQYAIEKGYLVPEKDFPLLYRKHGEVVGSSEGVLGIVNILVSENLKRRFGYTYKQIYPVLDPNGFEDYITNDSLFVEFQNEQKIKKEDPNHVSDIDDFFSSFVEGYDFFPNTDNVDIELLTGIKPIETNGKWNKTLGTISWSSKIGRDGLPKLPETVYAFWVSHDISFQEKYFGRVIVEGSDLLEYCMWHAALDKQDRKEWDTFLLTLNSESNSDHLSQKTYLEKVFNDFEFSDMKDADIKVSIEREKFRQKGKDNFLSEIRNLKKGGEGEKVTDEKKVISSTVISSKKNQQESNKDTIEQSSVIITPIEEIQAFDKYAVGEWINIDEDTRGTSRLVISEKDEGWFINGWGKCHPTDCDWGEVPLLLVDEKSYGRNFIRGFATWEFILKKDYMTLQVRDDHLFMETINIFTDSSKRSNYYSAEEFERK